MATMKIVPKLSGCSIVSYLQLRKQLYVAGLIHNLRDVLHKVWQFCAKFIRLQYVTSTDKKGITTMHPSISIQYAIKYVWYYVVIEYIFGWTNHTLAFRYIDFNVHLL